MIKTISPNTYIYLDLLRGAAAILVFIGHLRALIFTNDKTGFTIVGKAFYFITGFGHEAVMVFFVLSGFFITKSISSAVSSDNKLFCSHRYD